MTDAVAVMEADVWASVQVMQACVCVFAFVCVKERV